MIDKIVICGGYGCKNLGDDAQLVNNCRLFHQHEYNNVKIISHREYISALCGYPTIGSFRNYFTNSSNKNLLIEKFNTLINHTDVTIFNNEVQNLIKEIKNCDVLFMSGSGTLNTRTWFGALLALIPIALASRFNKRIILSGQGFLPMNNAEIETFFSTYLNKCEKIFTRDFELGKKELLRIGINPSLIKLGIDDAYTLPQKPMNIFIPPKMVGINMSMYGTNESYKKLIALANELKRRGYNPVFNSFFYKDKEIIDSLNLDYPIVEFSCPEEASWFFSNCLISIGMRYHSTILSLGAKTPAINIFFNEYQEAKLKAFNKEVPVLLDGNNFEIEHVLTLISNLNKLKEKTLNLWRSWINEGNQAFYSLNKKDDHILKLIKSRRSIRQFTQEPIKETDLLSLVEAGIYAPSGSNTQCYRFKLVTNRNDISFLADKKIKIVNNAQAIILVMADYNECLYLNSKRSDVFKDLPIQDCAMAMQNICILAESKKISQCVIQLSETWPTAQEIKTYFQIPNHYKLQGMILLGYANTTVDYENDKHAGKQIKRKPIQDYMV